VAKEFSDQLTEIKRAAVVGLISEKPLGERLVLKGGNALELVHRISTRASFDVDFSIEGEFESVDWLRNRAELGLERQFRSLGLRSFDVTVEDRPPQLSDDLRDFWGGYLVTFKVIELSQFERWRNDIELLRRHSLSVGPRNSTKFEVEISCHEWCAHRQTIRFEGHDLLVYTPEMIVSEKLRAICQQMREYGPVVKRMRAGSMRPRDFFDIVTIREWFPGIEWTSGSFLDLVTMSFQAKRVPLELLARIESAREFHRAGFDSLRATVRPGVVLEEFDRYFDDVVSFASSLHALGNE